MSNTKISKKHKKIFRIIGILGFVLLMISCAQKIIVTYIYGFSELNSKSWLLKILLLNTFCSILFFLIILKPERLEFFSLISFVYMIDILTTDNDNLIPIFMLALCLITLNLRGFFRKRKFLKLSLLFVSYFIALFTEIRFGFNTFFQSLLLHLAAFFISSICAILINKRHAEMQNSIVPKILDLTEYDQLSDQDRTIIKLLKEGQKYDWIAGHLGIATSTLKKRVKNIFEILGVVDLIDFHAQLGTLTFIYTKEELLGWKKRFLEENYGV